MYRWIIAVSFAVIATASVAEDTSPPIVMSGGMICDTLEQAIEAAELNQNVDGCGRLTEPALGTVTQLPYFETRGKRFKMARFDFISPTAFNKTQYGYWGSPEPIEGIKPVGQEI